MSDGPLMASSLWPQIPVEVSQRVCGGADVHSGAFEKLFQIMIVVDVEATEGWRLFSGLQFAAAEPVLPAGPSDHITQLCRKDTISLC